MKKLTLLLLIIGLLPSLFTFASVSKSEKGPKVIVGVSWSLGKMGNSDSTVQSRSVDVLDFHVLPGWRFGRLSFKPLMTSWGTRPSVTTRLVAKLLLTPKPLGSRPS